MQTNVNYTTKGNIGFLSFSSEQHNSFTLEMLQEMETTIRDLENVSHLKAIVIQSEGERTFCAGANLESLKEAKSGGNAQKFFSGFGKLIQAMTNSSKLIICRVQGKAVGGANGIIAASDVVFAGPYASTRLSEIGIGIGPFVIGPVLKHKLGLAKFSELAWSPEEWKDPQWAQENGLYSRIYQTTDKMDEDLSAFCKQVEQWYGKTIDYNKRMMWDGFEMTNDIIKSMASKSADLLLQEGVLDNLSA